jgi:hypothetical protein
MATKDKDLMRDTGGKTKKRNKEPNHKPSRNENKNPYREKNLTKEEKHEMRDTIQDKDLKSSPIKKFLKAHAIAEEILNENVAVSKSGSKIIARKILAKVVPVLIVRFVGDILDDIEIPFEITKEMEQFVFRLARNEGLECEMSKYEDAKSLVLKIAFSPFSEVKDVKNEIIKMCEQLAAEKKFKVSFH